VASIESLISTKIWLQVEVEVEEADSWDVKRWWWWL
jgi:hypothetical protein